MMAQSCRSAISFVGKAVTSSQAHILKKQVHSSIANGAAASSKPVERSDHETTCTLIPGDGVGPELVYSVQQILKAAGAPVLFEQYMLSETHPTMSASLDDVCQSIERNGVCLKGILDTPEFSHTGELETLNMKLRNKLDLYANVVHAKSLPGLETRHKDIDFVIIREQTEGEYSALEHESVQGVVECLKICTKKKTRRIAKFAFDYAVKHGRKKVTAVHKANIMKLGDGLFLQCCEEISKLYPTIEFENMIIDNCTMQMVSNPHQFDVLVMGNLYGNIIDNLAAGLCGGAGITAGASYSRNCVVYEPGARHTFAQASGKNVANPTALILASVNMLQHVNLHEYSELVKTALERVVLDGKIRTKDQKGHATTNEFTTAVIKAL